MTDFTEKIYAAVRRIPPGKVASYGQIAFLCGRPRASRIVGAALSLCRDMTVPCHRVLYKDGSLCKGDAFGGRELQKQLLMNEGVGFLPDGRADMENYGWEGIACD